MGHSHLCPGVPGLAPPPAMDAITELLHSTFPCCPQGLCLLLPSAQGGTCTMHGSSTAARLSKCSFPPTNTVFLLWFLYSKYLEYWCFQRITEIAIRQLGTLWQPVSEQPSLCSTGISQIPASSFSQESRQGHFVLVRGCRLDVLSVAGGAVVPARDARALPACDAMGQQVAAGRLVPRQVPRRQQCGSSAWHRKWSGCSPGTPGFPCNLSPLLSAMAHTRFSFDQPRLPMPPTGTWKSTQGKTARGG